MFSEYYTCAMDLFVKIKRCDFEWICLAIFVLWLAFFFLRVRIHKYGKWFYFLAKIWYYILWYLKIKIVVYTVND